MLDPLTIATSCLSLINGITSLTMHITVFVNDVRGARKDMDLISRELISLSLCLGALRTDCQSNRVDYPEASHVGIERTLLSIDVLTQQVKDVLQKLSSGKLGRRIQWTIQSKDTVNQLRSSLETQKSTIEIILQCGSIQILCAIQKQVEKPAQDLSRLTDTTQAIRKNTEVLRKDAVDIKELIRQEADILRVGIAALEHGKTLSTELQDFLRLSQDYSNRVADPFLTPAQSDSGLEDPVTQVFSQSSLVLTPGSLANPVETAQVAEQEQNTGPMCSSCGHIGPVFWKRPCRTLLLRGKLPSGVSFWEHNNIMTEFGGESEIEESDGESEIEQSLVNFFE